MSAGDLNTNHKSLAANIGYAFISPFSDSCSNIIALLTDGLKKVGIAHASHYLICARGDYRVAAEGGSVMAGAEGAFALFSYILRASSETTPKTLCQCANVGSNSETLERKDLTRSSDTRLNLVKDEKNIIFLTEALKERGIAIG